MGVLEQQKLANENRMRNAMSNIDFGMIRQEPSMADRALGVARRMFWGENDPRKRSVFDPEFVPMKGAPAKYEGVGMDLVMPAITAFHGSPHKFSKFDMSKIGTGEGAQAYGHGLYFAENPKVAKDYARKLARDHIQYTDPVLDKYNPIWKELSIQDKQLTQKIANAKTQHEFNRLQDTRGKVNDEMDRIQKIMIEEGGKQVKAQESLYKVDIPDENIDKMLDWDKTLSEQSKSVKESLKRYGVLRSTKPITQSTEPNGRIIFRDERGKMVATAIPDGKRYKLSSTTANLEGFSLNRPAVDKKQAQKVAEGWWSGNNITGEQLVQGMGRSEEGARALRKHGIPGIKYLDQGSRQGGKGTQNFVVFDDQIPQILEINDNPLVQNLMR